MAEAKILSGNEFQGNGTANAEGKLDKDVDSSINDGDELINSYISNPVSFEKAGSYFNKKVEEKKEEDEDEN